jgi:hypothetical protein
MSCFLENGNNKYICSTVNKNQMYPSFIPTTAKVIHVSQQQQQQQQQQQLTDAEIIFMHVSLYLIFPLLYNMLSQGNKSAVMKLWRFIHSGVIGTTSYLREIASSVFYATLRMFGQYGFSTYTVVKDGREVYSASSLFYYYKSDCNNVYQIDPAKYKVCKWIDKQCQLFERTHHDRPEVNDLHNDIYDFILHKVDNQHYTRIHRGDFTGRTHTLITEHYRPYTQSFKFMSDAELAVYVNSTTVEAPLVSSTAAPDDDCKMTPLTFNINLKTPHNFFLEKNEVLDAKFLQWVLYQQYGRPEIAKYLRSPFYNYKLTLYYNESMKPYFNDQRPPSSKVVATLFQTNTAVEPTRYVAYNLNDQQSVLIGHTYIVKVDAILRCPVFETGETRVYDIDNIVSSYYDCSDSDSESVSETETVFDVDQDDQDDHDHDHDHDHETGEEQETEPGTIECDEFEVIQETSK